MVGADTMAAVDAACAALTPAMTETEAAGAVTAACRAAGLFASALMVGGADGFPATATRSQPARPSAPGP